MKKSKNKIDKKVYIIMMIGIMIGIIISITSSYVLAQTLVNSKDVYYEDNSGLAVNNVQAAIDGTCTKFSNQLQEFLLKVYPVGSIYISYNSTNPSSLFGGTWETFGKGQTIVGIDSSSTEFKTLGQTGGAKNISYTPSGTVGSTTLTTDQIPSHTHSISHTHTTPKEDASYSLQASGGAHTHIVADLNFVGNAGCNGTSCFNWNSTVGWGTVSLRSFVGGDGSHTHNITGSITVPSMTTNGISTTTSGSTGGGKGHTHSFTGSAATLNNLQPYITVYMWRRTK